MGPSPMPNGMSALWHASAAFRCASQGQASISGVYPTFSGCIAVTSMPAAAFNTLMRAHGGFACAPQLEGRPSNGRRSGCTASAQFCRCLQHAIDERIRAAQIVSRIGQSLDRRPIKPLGDCRSRARASASGSPSASAVSQACFTT